MHCACVLLFSYGKFTTNYSNKNIHFGIFALWKTIYKITHLLKGFPRYRRIRK